MKVEASVLVCGWLEMTVNQFHMYVVATLRYRTCSPPYPQLSLLSTGVKHPELNASLECLLGEALTSNAFSSCQKGGCV